MGTRQEDHSGQRAFILTLSAIIPVTLFCAFKLLRIPADQKNAFLFGLSKERLLMFSGFVLLLSADILALICRRKTYPLILNNNLFEKICLALSVLSLFLFLMPDYRFHKASAYYNRLKPYILWLFLTTTLFTVFFRYTKDRFSRFHEFLTNLITQRKFIIPVFLLILAGIAFIEISGLGKTVEASLWNKNGVPLQSIQLFSAIVIFAVLWKRRIFMRIVKHRRLFHFLLIWAAAALIWSLAPKSPHFFSPGPYEPDLQYYPYSDAVTYDIAAQTAVNGWGFNLKRTVLKPALVFIDFLSHLVTGNNYNLSMYVQSGLFAILPAIIFLFGEAIGGIGCGYLAAVFSVFKEWNALNTHTVLTIHSRLIMSEFLMQIIFASFCYAVFRWLKKDGKENFYAVIAGGTVMLGIFTRYNFMGFVPAALLLVIIAYKKHMRNLLKPLLFFFLSMFLTAAPMIIRDAVTSSGMISELTYTIQNVLIRQRFQEKSPFSDADGADSGDDSPKALQPQNTSDFSRNQNDEFNTGQITQEFSNNNSIKNLPLLPSIFNHSLHNFTASFLTLPMEITFQDLPHLYTQEGDGLWRDNWQGGFSFGQWMMVGLWVITGSITFGLLIKNFGIAGFSIPYFWFVYAFSIGFSRSSGGRYVVPMNWIPMLLLAYLITLICSKGLQPVLPEKSSPFISGKKIYWALAAFTLFFTAMLLFENFMPSRKTAAQESDLTIIKERLSDHEEIDWAMAEKQEEEGLLHITHGVVAYPRFYYYLKGEHASYGSAMVKDFSRLTFMGINMGDEDDILYQEYLMPHKDTIDPFPRDSIFRAVSCRSEFGYEDILAVTIETPQGEVYTYMRDPLPEFSCPVPEPVCYSIENCY